MNQLLTLIRFDLRAQLRERGTVLMMAAALLLAAFGMLEGARAVRHAGAAVADAALQEARARSDANALAARYFAAPDATEFAGLLWWRTPVDIRGYAFREHVGFAAKPNLPGAALAIGQADVLPAYVRVRAESMESVRTAAEIDHPARLAAGRYDLMFFVVYLWPLILLSLCGSVLTQDRESRRLRNLQLQGVALLTLLTAQVAARAALATLALLAFCAAFALATGAVPRSAEGGAALLAWAGVVLVYSAFWATVAMAVCALCANRLGAAFAGFGAWLVLAIVVPGALGASVQAGAPVPGRESYVRAMRDAGDAVAADKLNSLARFYDSHPEWKPVKTALDNVSSSVSRIQRAQELEKAMAGVEREFQQAKLRRDTLFARLVPFSPVTLAYQALARLAGNDGVRHERFIADVQRHHARLRDYFQTAIQQAALGDERAPCAKACLGGYGFRAFDAVPRFEASQGLSRPPATGTALPILAAWSAAVAALAAGLLRYAGRGRHAV